MTINPPPAPNQTGKFRLASLLFLALCVFFFCLFAGLGIWQLQRLQWKQALIERVETRVNLPPIPAPPAPEWEQVTAHSHEYRPVTAHGKFLPDSQILVSTVTDYGSGYWLLQALQQADGSHIFINRGFVPMNWEMGGSWEMGDGNLEGEVELTGLLRLSEGAGFWPRRNNPARNRWYSRQLDAFATMHHLENVAPYFIDADASLNEEGLNRKGAPIGGLTIVTFRNTHLSYAITWFVMASGVLAAFIFLLIHGRKKD